MKIQGYEVNAFQEETLVDILINGEALDKAYLTGVAIGLGIPEFNKRPGCFSTHCAYRVVDSILRRLKREGKITLAQGRWSGVK